ncbi:hypothetical protein ACFVYV_43400 [Streptomyces mirabilis]|uniref:hypothetical protein n=1 Tax=Streptomyces mirabilis TaxID=68239 RepID=UPI0036DD35AF
MTTAAGELRTAAQTLLDLADETTEEIEANDYWHSQVVDRPHWYANGIDNAVGGPAGKLAGLFTPETTREIAAWLRAAAEYADKWPPDHQANSPFRQGALAVARQINGAEQR